MRRCEFYTQDAEGNPVEEPDLGKWSEWMATADRTVARTKIDAFNATVSTVFLGLDHSYTAEGLPLLYETMVFQGGSAHDEFMMRYSTLGMAKQGHDEVCSKLVKRLN